MTGRSDCAAFQEHLVEAAYGELTSAAAELLAAHLAICERCREESDWLGASRQALRTALAAPSHDAPGTLMVLPRGQGLFDRLALHVQDARLQEHVNGRSHSPPRCRALSVAAGLAANLVAFGTSADPPESRSASPS